MVKITKVFRHTLLIILSLAILNVAGLSAEVSARAKKLRYESLQAIFNSSDIALQINSKSKSLDLAKTNNLRLRIKVNDLYTSIENQSSFKIELYEIVNGVRTFISTQNVTVNKGSRESLIVSIGAGFFDTPNKQIEFDIYDTEGNLTARFASEINASNLQAQIATNAESDLLNVDCSELSDEDCMIDTFFRRVTFEARKQRRASTRVIKNNRTGLYKVTIPVPREGFRFLRGNRVNLGGSTPTNNDGVQTTALGEIFTSSGLIIATNDGSEHTSISYDSVSDQLEIGFNGTTQRTMVVGRNGKVGIGVDDPNAFLQVRNGMGTMPSMIINQGPLASALHDGAIEFDGNDLFLTKNGVRAPIGSSNLNPNSLLESPILNGDIQIGSTGIFNGTISADAFSGDGSGLTGISVNSITGGTVTTSTLSNNTLNNNNLSNNVLLDNVVNGTLTFNNGQGDIQGNLSINGSIFANAGFNIDPMVLQFHDPDTVTSTDPRLVAGLTLQNDSTIDDTGAAIHFTSEQAPEASAGIIGRGNYGDSMGLEFYTENGNGNDIRMTITENGNVGIGTTSPAAELQVVGTILADNLTGTNLNITNAITTGGLNTTGTVNAGAFVGDGSGLTNLPLTAVNNGSFQNVTINNGTLTNFDSITAAQFIGGTFTGDGSGLTGLSASNFNNGTLQNVTLNNGTLASGSTIEGATINGSTLLRNSVNGLLTFLSNASIEGNVTVNGTVAADNFTGDGSGLINVAANTANFATNANNATTANTADLATFATNASNATTANSADFATNAMNATLATLAATAQDLSTEATIEGNTINGANITDNTINGILTFINNASIEGDVSVNGTVTADNISGDGSGLTNLTADFATNAGNATTSNTADLAIFATNAGNATTADSAIFASNAGNASTANTADIATTANNVAAGGTIEGTTINGSNILNNSVNGLLTFTNNASIEGDVSVNGTVTADNISGDGSGLTNLTANFATNAGNATTSNTADLAIFATNAGNATTADSAIFATNAGNASTANTADIATTANNVAAGGTIEGTTINGSNILNNSVNGLLTFTNNASIEGDVSVNGTVTADNITGDGSGLTNLTANFATNAGNATTSNTADLAIFATNAANATIANTADLAIFASNAGNASTANTADIATTANNVAAGGTIEGTTINGSNILNNSVNGLLTFTNNASIEGDVSVNGTVTADNISGDGSGLTNLTANFATNAGNATTSNTADLAIFATNAGNATTANAADTASNLTGGTIQDGNINGQLTFNNNSTVEGDIVQNGTLTNTGIVTDSITFTAGGTINGATLLNTTVTLSQLAAADGSPNPALQVDNDGNVGIGTANSTEKLVVNGNVVADSFIGDGSGLTNLNLAGANLGNGTLNDPLLNNPVINGSVSFRPGTLLESFTVNGAITTNGAVFATLFNGQTFLGDNFVGGNFFGNGAGLTGVNAATAGTANFATNAGNATTSNTANLAIFATNAANATTANTADLAIFATNAGNATTANTADIATTANNLAAGGTIEGAIINGSNILNNTVNGLLTFTNNASIEGDVSVNGNVTADSFTGDGSALTGVNADNASTANLADTASLAIFATNSQNASTANIADLATFAINAGNATTANSADQANTANSLSTGAVLESSTVNGTLTFTNNSQIEGDITVNGTVTANSFVGDGSGLTNVNLVGSNISNGTIDNPILNNPVINGSVSFRPGTLLESFTVNGAITTNGAVFATLFNGQTFLGDNFVGGNFFGNGAGLTGVNAATAANANFATNAGNATTANTADIASFAINAGNATTANSADSANALSAGATIEAPTINGTLTFTGNSQIEGDVTVNGTVTASAFIGNGAGLTGINGQSIVGNITNIDNISNVTINNGTISNVTIDNGSVNNTTINNPTLTGNGDITLNGNVTAAQFNGDQFIGTFTYQPSAPISVGTTTTIPSTNSLMRIQGNGPAVVNLTSSPQIAPGRDGQILVIRALSNASKVRLDDGDGLALTRGVPFRMGARDTITLVYDALLNEWVEITRSNKQ